MNFTFSHNNFNVTNLEKSLAFYQEALGLFEVRRIAPEDGSFIIVFLEDGTSSYQLELTWLRDWEQDSYNLGDNEFQLAFTTNDYPSAQQKHEAMQCICFENKEMGIYFISDPDGYWIEIIPAK